MLAAPQAVVPVLIGRPVLIAIFAGVLVLSAFGLVGAIYDTATGLKRLRDVPRPPGSPERIIAQGLRRSGLGRIVMMTASLLFGLITLAATMKGTFSMSADFGGIVFMTAVCAPGVVTTVLTLLEIIERIRIDRIYTNIEAPRSIARFAA